MKTNNFILCILAASSTIIYCSSQQLLLNKACKCGNMKEYHEKYKTEPMKNLTGGRSRQSIKEVVENKVSELNYAYNQRLKSIPELKGQITVKFAIDECGKVIFCQTVGSTITFSR